MAGSFVIEKEKLEVRMERVFKAPRARVWQAYTDPKLIAQWWGPRKYKVIVDKLDFQVGGAWRFLNVDDKGEEYAFSGEFKEIVEPERITWTFKYEPYPNSVVLETVTFEDQGDETSVKSVSRYASIEELEGMVNSGMEKGATESHDRLEELLETL